MWAVCRVALDRAEDLPAVHAGEVDVEDHDGGTQLPDRGQPVGTAATADRLQPGGVEVQGQQLGRAGVVLDDDDERTSVARGQLDRPSEGVGSPAGRVRDGEAEGAPVAELAGEPQPPTVQLDDPLGQGEAQAGALDRAGRPGALLEGVEDPVLVGSAAMPMPVSVTVTSSPSSAGAGADLTGRRRG